MTPSDTAVHLAMSQRPEELWQMLRLAVRHRRQCSPEDRLIWTIVVRDHMAALELQALEPAYVANALVFGSAKGVRWSG